MKKYYILAFITCLGVALACEFDLWQAPRDSESTVDPQTESVTTIYTEDVSSESLTDDAPQTEEIPQTEEAPSITEKPVYYDCPLSHDLQDYIRELCDRKGVPMTLVLALIEIESSFQADVISRTDDYGLMQINAINHGWLYEKYGITDFLDPYNNILCGITILSMHYESYGDETKALMAYNMGAFGAKRKWDIGVYETPYTNKILSAKERYDLEIK